MYFPEKNSLIDKIIPIARAAWLPLLAASIIFFIFSGTVRHYESDDSFCASCHVEPEKQFYLQSIKKGVPETLASYHAGKDTACIECHSGPWITGQAAAQISGLINLYAYYTGNYTIPGKTKRPVGDGGCTRCHSDFMWMMERPAHYHSPQLRSKWSEMGGPYNTCDACHPSHTMFEEHKNHRIYFTEEMLKKRCDSCHKATGTVIHKSKTQDILRTIFSSYLQPDTAEKKIDKIFKLARVLI